MKKIYPTPSLRGIKPAGGIYLNIHLCAKSAGHFRRCRINSNQKGQGLLELVIAIGVITVGLLAVWTLFLSNFSGEKEAGTRIIAVNLAREGMETVKNIRDTNWLRSEVNDKTCVLNSGVVCKWDDGLADGNYIADSILIPQQYVSLTTVTGLDDQSTKIYLNPDGFYVNAAGTPTPYQRLITIAGICCPDANADLKCDSNIFGACGTGSNLKIGLNVQSQVRWQVDNKTRNIILVEQIYNWK